MLGAVNLFFPPTPLETATLFAGYLSGIGRGSILIVITATTAGMFCGSFILYSLVKTKGIAFLERTPLKKYASGKSHEKGMAWFKGYGIYAVFLGKLIPGMSLASVIGCGVFQWKTKTAALAFLGSNLIFYTVLAFTGKILGAYWGKALPWLTKISAFLILAVGIVTIIQIIRSFAPRQKP